MSDLKQGVTYELLGWGESHSTDPRKKNRRGGFWSHYTFTTLKEAKAEQKKQLADQAYKVEQKAIDLKRFGEKEAAFRWGEDFGHEFPVFEVTRKKMP